MQFKHTAKQVTLDGKQVWVVEARGPYSGAPYWFRYAYDSEPVEVVKNLNADELDSASAFAEKIEWNYVPATTGRQRLMKVRRPTTVKSYWHIVFN